MNQDYINNFHASLQKGLAPAMAGQPTVMWGGRAIDHSRGIGSKLATQFVPFHKETYTPTEFVYGFVPLKTQGMPALYFQAPVLDIKGKNIPGNVNFAAPVKATIAETVVSPFVGFGAKFVAMNALTDEQLSAKDALKRKARWTPLLEALNADKAALKAATPKYESASMGGYEVKVDGLSPMGLTQLAPYHGYTVITRQASPTLWAGVNKPQYPWEETLEHFVLLGSMVARFPQAGEEEGQQIVLQSNSSMMEMVFERLDQELAASGVARPPAAPAPMPPPVQVAPPAMPPVQAPPAMPPPAAPAMPESAPPPAPEAVPCPTCGKPVRIGFRFCPFCKQELVWQ